MKINSLYMKLLLAAFIILQFAFNVKAADNGESSAAESEVNKFLWDHHFIPENKFTLLDFYYGNVPDHNSDTKYEMLATGGPWDVHARQIRKGQNENGFFELDILMPYITISWSRPAFVIERNHRADGNTVFYPIGKVNDSGTEEMFADTGTRWVEPESGVRYLLKEDESYREGNFGLEKLNFFLVGKIDDVRFKSETSGSGPNDSKFFNVMVRLEFEDENFEAPKYVSFVYNMDKKYEPKNGGRPMFIGTLAQTSKEYEQGDPYGGWNTWVPFESHGKMTKEEFEKDWSKDYKLANENSVAYLYPYTYTFKPKASEYDLAIYLQVDRPKRIGKYALMAQDKETYQYLSYWSNEYDFTTSLHRTVDNDNWVDINHDLGRTKPFPGSPGPGYTKYQPDTDEDDWLGDGDENDESLIHYASSIHLTNLDTTKVYRLTIGKAEAMWYNIEANFGEKEPSRLYVADALAWVSLMEYTPAVKAYQLVRYDRISADGEDVPRDEEGRSCVYFTFDADTYQNNKTADEKTEPKTYKLIFDNNDMTKLTYYREVSDSIVENEMYKSADYSFTDMLFVRTDDPEWMLADDVDAVITNLQGTFLHNKPASAVDTGDDNGNGDTGDDSDPVQQEIPSSFFSGYRAEPERPVMDLRDPAEKLIRKNEVNAFAYAVCPMNEKIDPVYRQSFTFNDGYIYDFKSDFDLIYSHYFFHYVADENGEQKRDEKGNIVTEITLVWADEDMKVDVDSTRVGDRPGWINKSVDGVGQLGVPTPMDSYVEYELTADKAVPAGEAKIKLHLQEPVSEETNFKKDPELENGLIETYDFSDKTIHSHDYNIVYNKFNSNMTEALKEASEDYVKFLFGIDERDDYDTWNANLNGTPVFKNADMDYIYNTVINQKNGRNAVRTMKLSVTGDGADRTVIYDRWEHDMKAEVDLDLNAPQLSFKESTGKASSSDYPENSDKEGYNLKKIYQVTLDGITNTDDKIVDNDNQKMKVGSADNDSTTLYLVEYYYTQNNSTTVISENPSYELLTYDDLISKVIKVNEFYFNTAGGWGGSPVDPYEESVKNKPYKPMRIRNVYIFPNKNPGFIMRNDITGEPLPSNRASIRLLADGEEDTFDYHGVTTPLANEAFVISGSLSGIEDIVDSTVDLARAIPGAVEVLSEGASLYGVDGTFIARGLGQYNVAPGLYIVTDHTQSQKLIVN